MKTNEILAIGNDVMVKNQKAGATIYTKEIFTGLSDKEKKAVRVKLRRKLDNFIASALSVQKDHNKLSVVKKAWNEYAKFVYVNTMEIVDANASDERIQSCKNFLQLMEEKKTTIAK